MKTNKTLQVFFHDRLVGTLAMTAAHIAAFEYCEDWSAQIFAPSNRQQADAGRSDVSAMFRTVLRFVWQERTPRVLRLQTNLGTVRDVCSTRGSAGICLRPVYTLPSPLCIA